MSDINARALDGAPAGHMLRDVWQDARCATRTLRRQPAFIVLTLALGIGATAAIFTVVQGVLLNPLRYPDANRVVRVAATVHGSREEERRNQSFSPRGYWLLVESNRSFQKFGGSISPGSGLASRSKPQPRTRGA